MEQTQGSEISAIKHHTPENNQKNYTRHSERSESLKSKTLYLSLLNYRAIFQAGSHRPFTVEIIPSRTL
jgi:hypothetical protein